jgi:hypothetical protein
MNGTSPPSSPNRGDVSSHASVPPSGVARDMARDGPGSYPAFFDAANAAAMSGTLTAQVTRRDEAM